jgi:hypothetical protein
MRDIDALQLVCVGIAVGRGSYGNTALVSCWWPAAKNGYDDVLNYKKTKPNLKLSCAGGRNLSTTPCAYTKLCKTFIYRSS